MQTIKVIWVWLNGKKTAIAFVIAVVALELINPNWKIQSEFLKDVSVQYLLLKIAELLGGVGIAHKAQKSLAE